MIPPLPHDIDSIVEDELYTKGPSWFTELADSLGILDPYANNGVGWDTPEQVQRALIRIVLVLLSFEEMLGVGETSMLDRALALYPVVKRKAENMTSAIEMKWMSHQEG